MFRRATLLAVVVALLGATGASANTITLGNPLTNPSYSTSGSPSVRS